MLLQRRQLPGARAAPSGGAGRHRAAARHVAARVAAPEQVSPAPAPAGPAPASPPATSRAQLPADLANAVAVLEAPNAAAPGGATRVFVLGVSHVSAVSCEQVKQLVRAVRPEVVVVELCKERLGLLVDPDNPDRRQETWHCRQVSIEGIPADDPLWPTAAQLQELLVSRIGAAITTRDIEADVSRLLATGLFGKARPVADNAGRGEAPQFGAVKPEGEDGRQGEPEGGGEQQEQRGTGGGAHTGEVGLQLVPPLGGLKFVVEPRQLPLVSSVEVRLDSSLRGHGVELQQLQDAASALLAEAAARRGAEQRKEEAKEPAKEEGKEEGKDREEGGSLQLYLRTRAALAGMFPDAGQVVVDFSGVETGRVEALVRARRAADASFVSGLEGSAAGGEGVAIEAFRPQRSSVQLSPGMLLPAEAAERLAAARAARQAERVLGPAEGWQRRTQYRLWGQEEVGSGADSQLPPNPVADTFARLMTGLYSRLQSAAGDAAGVSSGAAWRAALEAACEVGSQQVLLGDRPTDVSQRRLAESITAASGGRLAAALALLAGGAAAAAAHALPGVEAAAAGAVGSAAAGDAAIVAAAGAGALALAWPVLAPFVEVWQFSRLSGEQVEDTVAIKQPLQERLDEPFFVWGEDALLGWPGAVAPLIEERDEFMARVVAAAAAGGNPNVPAYVADEDGGQLIWRYMVPRGATAPSAPKGAGDGEFEPLQAPAAVVAVVGSAHVRGMCKRWAGSLAAAGQVDDLLRAD